MGQTKGMTQYEVRAQKLGNQYSMVLWVSITRGARGKKKLLGEAYARTPEQPQLYFKVNKGSNEEEIYAEFLKLLIWRGFLPKEYRTKKDSTYSDWSAVSLDGLDIEQVLEKEKLNAI